MSSRILVGIDIGGTKTSMAFFSNGEIQMFYQEPTPQDPEEALHALVSGIKLAKLPGAIEAIGVGCPGPLDHRHGVIHLPPNLPKWKHFKLGERLSDFFQVPVLIDNDANTGALGEAIHGAGKGYHTVMYVTISTGLGAGIVIDGRLHRGAFGLAGEIWAFVPSYFASDRAKENLIELCSGNGLVSRASECIAAGSVTSIPSEDISVRTILAAFNKDDALARELIDSARQTLASTLAFSLHLLAPDIIILGGGLCTETSWFVDPVREKISEMIALGDLKKVPVVRAVHLKLSTLFGAIELVSSL